MRIKKSLYSLSAILILIFCLSIGAAAKETFTLYYDANGGSGGPSSSSGFSGYLSGTGVTISSSEPSRSGYTFVCWNTSSNGSGTDWYAGETFQSLTNRTLYAHWTANYYYVAYNGNGATGGSTATSTHYFDTSKALTANGYERKYIVTYNYNGSGQSNSTSTATYTFKKWNGVYSDKQSVLNLTTVYGDTVTLNAYWNPGSVTLKTPTRTGYLFGGWYTESGCTNKIGNGGTTYTPTANITLYAKWVPVTYYVAYNGNNATGGSTATSTHTYDVSKTLTANGFERKYTVTFDQNYAGSSKLSDTATYTFDGWALSSSGAVKYTDKKSVINLSAIHGTTVQLYAKWTAHSITLKSLSRTGYYLEGWYSESELINKVGNPGDTYTPSSTQTLYAKWIPYRDIVVTTFLDGIKNKGLETTGVLRINGVQYDTSNEAVKVTALEGSTYKIEALDKISGSYVTLATGTVPSTGITANVNYYTLTLTKDSGVTGVTGAASYLMNTVVDISATIVGSPYNWDKWATVSGSSANSANLMSTTVTVAATTVLKAQTTIGLVVDTYLNDTQSQPFMGTNAVRINGIEYDMSSGRQTIEIADGQTYTVEVRRYPSSDFETYITGTMNTSTDKIEIYYYSLGVSGDTGINWITVTGDGAVFLKDTEVSLSAIVKPESTWKLWQVTYGNVPANVNNKSTTVTINCMTALKALTDNSVDEDSESVAPNLHELNNNSDTTNDDDKTDYIEVVTYEIEGQKYKFVIDSETDEIQEGEIFLYGDYMYVYGYYYTGGFINTANKTNWTRQSAVTGWGCAAIDKTKTSYNAPLSSIAGYHVTYYTNCYANCTNLVYGPALSYTAVNADYIFSGCSSLKKASLNGAEILGKGAFNGCTSLKYVFFSTSLKEVKATNASEAPFYSANASCKITCEETSAKAEWGSYWNTTSSGTLSTEYDVDIVIWNMYGNE